MKRLLPLLLILPLAGFRPAPMPPPAYEGGPVRMSLVDRDRGTELRSYPAEGQRWVAGERGHRYAVRLYNDSPRRVLVVLSVDGVNAISGEDADPSQTGYVLNPGQRIQEQRARQPVLQAAGGMARLILQVQVDALEPWHRQRDQVGIGGTVEISFDLADGGSHPFTLRHGGQSLSGRNGAIRPLYVAVPSGAGR